MRTRSAIERLKMSEGEFPTDAEVEAARSQPVAAPAVARLAQPPSGEISEDEFPTDAEVEAARTPKPVAVAAPSAVSRFAQTPAAVAKPEKIEDPEAPSIWSKIARLAPSVISAGVGAAVGTTPESRQRGFGMLAQASKENSNEDARFRADKRRVAGQNAQNAKDYQANTRQAGIDATNKEKAVRDFAADDRAIRDDEETRDPASRQNVTLRKGIEQQYPQIWNNLPPEEREGLTLRDMPALAARFKQADAQSQHERDLGKVEFTERKQLEYNTNFPNAGGTVILNANPVNMDQARKDLDTAWGGKTPPAALSQLNNLTNFHPSQQAAEYAKILANAPGGKTAPNPKGTNASAPPDGFEVIDTPGSRAAWERSLQDAGARKTVASVTTGLPGIKNNLARMIQLRKQHGTELMKTAAKAEYEQLHGQVIGYLNRVVSDAGVLNKGEYEIQKERLGTLGPSFADAQRFVGGPDPVLADLMGAQSAMDSMTANSLAGVGLRQRSQSAGQREIAGSAQPGQRGVVAGQDAGKTRQLKLANGQTAADTPANREKLTKAGVGFEEVQ